jgi:spore coat polysaccharide biosynthesis protein SpsF (cytidylyltransferase family)
MKVIATIQARMGSSRLPGKVIRLLDNKTVLACVIERVEKSRCEAQILCIPDNDENDILENIFKDTGVEVYRGSEENVLGRLYNSVEPYGEVIVVRITADNPLVDPKIIDYLIDQHIKNGCDVTTNYFSKTFPNGTIVSIINSSALKYMYENMNKPEISEHIVYGFHELPSIFRVQDIVAPKVWNRPDIRFCLDSEEDWSAVLNILKQYPLIGGTPNTQEIIRIIDENIHIKNMNIELALKGY